MQAVFTIKIDECAPFTCQSREFIDLKISGVTGKCKSGQGWTGPMGRKCEQALCQAQGNSDAGDTNNSLNKACPTCRMSPAYLQYINIKRKNLSRLDIDKFSLVIPKILSSLGNKLFQKFVVPPATHYCFCRLLIQHRQD